MQVKTILAVALNGLKTHIVYSDPSETLQTLTFMNIKVGNTRAIEFDLSKVRFYVRGMELVKNNKNGTQTVLGGIDPNGKFHGIIPPFGDRSKAICDLFLKTLPKIFSKDRIRTISSAQIQLDNVIVFDKVTIQFPRYITLNKRIIR